MTIVSRAGALLAAAVLCLSTPTLALNPVPDRMSILVASLNVWLDGNSAYVPRSEPVKILRIDPDEARTLDGYHADEHLQTRALYEPATASIYLIEPWSMNDPQDVAVLLHELVHHRQQGARHFYCPGAQEPDAYLLQETWLSENGLDAPINWIAVTLDAGCVRRDIHPR